MLASLVLAGAVCGAAERALPANGVEVAFEGRKRVTLDLRAAAFRTTMRPDVRVVELRAELGASMAITPSSIVGVDAPILRRSVTTDATNAIAATRPDARIDHTILGDVELRASHTDLRSIAGTSRSAAG